MATVMRCTGFQCNRQVPVIDIEVNNLNNDTINILSGVLIVKTSSGKTQIICSSCFSKFIENKIERNP